MAPIRWSDINCAFVLQVLTGLRSRLHEAVLIHLLLLLLHGQEFLQQRIAVGQGLLHSETKSVSSQVGIHVAYST